MPEIPRTGALYIPPTLTGLTPNQITGVSGEVAHDIRRAEAKAAQAREEAERLTRAGAVAQGVADYSSSLGRLRIELGSDGDYATHFERFNDHAKEEAARIREGLPDEEGRIAFDIHAVGLAESNGLSVLHDADKLRVSDLNGSRTARSDQFARDYAEAGNPVTAAQIRDAFEDDLTAATYLTGEQREAERRRFYVSGESNAADRLLHENPARMLQLSTNQAAFTATYPHLEQRHRFNFGDQARAEMERREREAAGPAGPGGNRAGYLALSHLLADPSVPEPVKRDRLDAAFELGILTKSEYDKKTASVGSSGLPTRLDTPVERALSRISGIKPGAFEPGTVRDKLAPVTQAMQDAVLSRPDATDAELDHVITEIGVRSGVASKVRPAVPPIAASGTQPTLQNHMELVTKTVLLGKNGKLSRERYEAEIRNLAAWRDYLETMQEFGEVVNPGSAVSGGLKLGGKP